MVPVEEAGLTDSSPGPGAVSSELLREALKTEDVIASVTITTFRVNRRSEIEWK